MMAHMDELCPRWDLSNSYEMMNHSVCEYVSGRTCAHGIKSVQSTSEGVQDRLFHMTGHKHLQRCTDEFSVQHNVWESRSREADDRYRTEGDQEDVTMLRLGISGGWIGAKVICLTISLIAASLFFVMPVRAEDETELDLFYLWNDCKPMQLVVEGLDQDAADIGLTRETIVTTVRSRLRSARIYSDSTRDSYLYINVNVSSRAYNISIRYKKWLIDLFAERGYAATWTVGGVGTHGQDSGRILSVLSQYTDEFVDEYLRVNEEACLR